MVVVCKSRPEVDEIYDLDVIQNFTLLLLGLVHGFVY